MYRSDDLLPCEIRLKTVDKWNPSTLTLILALWIKLFTEVNWQRNGPAAEEFLLLLALGPTAAFWIPGTLPFLDGVAHGIL